jgi:hypothetical protein
VRQDAGEEDIKKEMRAKRGEEIRGENKEQRAESREAERREHTSTMTRVANHHPPSV